MNRGQKTCCLCIALLVITGAGVVYAAEPTSRELRRTPVVEVFQKTREAVVNITATQTVELDSRFGWLDQYFDLPGVNRQPQRYQRTNLGSGFILHSDGYVVTNGHVAARAAGLEVIFVNGEKHQAEPVAIDEEHDLAVLSISDSAKHPAIQLGRSDDLMVGETVIAIGNPLSYQHTVTAGIISALDRSITVGENVVYDNLIQTDTSINPGNSGGPLLNVLGELIGINTAIRGDAQNIGFAIPVDTLRKLLPEMLSPEHRKRLKVGLRLGWSGRPTVVEATGPAAEAGIEAGDELLRVNDRPVINDFDYYIYLLGMSSTDGLSLDLHRQGRPISVRVTPRPIPVPDGAELLRQKFGLSVRLLSEAQARDMDMNGRLLITAIERGSPAERAGFLPGLIIYKMGKYFPSDLGELGVLLEKVNKGEKVNFVLYEVQKLFIRAWTGTLVAR